MKPGRTLEKIGQESGIGYELAGLIDTYGPNHAGPWAVVRTRFHGGGVLSRHRDASRAVAAARKYRKGDCVCGCCGIVPLADIEKLPGCETNDRNGYSPYALCS